MYINYFTVYKISVHDEMLIYISDLKHFSAWWIFGLWYLWPRFAVFWVSWEAIRSDSGICKI